MSARSKRASSSLMVRKTSIGCVTGGSSGKSGLLVVARQERIREVARRDEGLLDRTRRDPPTQVQGAARLVVRSRGAAPAERLLADDRAGGLVVDVEVSGGVAQPLGHAPDL